MARDVRGVSFQPDLREILDDHHMELGYRYRSELIQVAVVEYLKQQDIDDVEDVDLEGLDC